MKFESKSNEVGVRVMDFETEIYGMESERYGVRV